MADKEERVEKEEKKELEKLTIKTGYGKIYFVLSIIETILCIVFASCAKATNNFVFIYLFAAFAFAYCFIVLGCEIVRTKPLRDKGDQDKPSEAKAAK